MNRFFESLRELAASIPFRIGAIVLLLMTFFVGSAVRSAGNLPPTVALSPDPLYSKGLRAKPTMTLALSVEFPTVGAQYVAAPNATEDATYSTSTQYIGYFDTESCYTYNNNSDPTLRRFDRMTAMATNRTCGGSGFSGNFMNWATSSAIDVLRFALTGGDRVVDTSALTVLQRAVLPNSNVSSNFWNGTNFPSKRLKAADAAGAVPTNLLNGYANDVFVANCLNRVHFGTQATGNCGSPGNNSNLGVLSNTVTSYSGALPTTPPPPTSSRFTYCAAENGTCNITGAYQVAYGANNSWNLISTLGPISCSNGTFGDPLSGTVKSCYYRPDPNATTVLSNDPFFYARVSVCDTKSDGSLADPRTTYCLKYPSGNFKPVGNLQRYSDNIRLAAFGYLNDSTGDPNQRYGGVLRAPMKYVGPKTFDQNFIQSTAANPQQEWDPQTGIFYANPDAATTGYSAATAGTSASPPSVAISGVTNYLNQFGRTGIFGQYKTYDPVGELYYEALRYIQGLPLTAAAVSGMTSTMQDGYPVYTTWTDPHPPVAGLASTGYKCVKNNILVIGDVNTWNDKSYPGNPAARANNGDIARAYSDANNEPNFYYWTQVVGSFEANGGLGYTDGQGVARSATNFNTPNTGLAGIADANTGAEGAAYYIAGAAYWANTHDIRGTNWSQTSLQRPGMRASTFVLDVNENAADSVYSTRTRTQFFLTGKYGGFNDVTGTGNPFKGYDASNAIVNSNANWSKPSITTDPTQLEAKNYYLSSSASSVVSALNDIFASIAKGANSIAGAAISTQSLSDAGTGYVYQARFDPVNYWAGDLVPLAISASGSSVSIGSDSTAPWKAAAVLDARNTLLAPRKIFIGSQLLTPTTTGMAFSWTSLDTATQALIKMPGDDDLAGAGRVNYLRGERLGEGTTYRLRGSRLGDIVNSGIAYSGPPPASISDTGYAQFARSNASRAGTLFVGANDGMLHAFDAATGNENFAYIPSWLASKVNQLTTSAYVHQSYVDASPVVGQANFAASNATANWKTVLVGGTGGGGQGVYALDITDPSAPTASDAGASRLLWEFTDKHDAALGNVVGKPQILKFRVGDLSGTPVFKWYAVVTSGVNNYAADSYASATAYPAIFILDLAKPVGTAWTVGSNYWKIELPRAATTTAQGVIGLSALYGTAGEVTYLYTGDLQGNLWKLDFTQFGVSSIPTTTASATSDPAADKFSFFKDSAGHAIPMYTAMDGSATPKAQPISMDPALIYGRNKSIIVAFGTGKYLETPDIAGSYTAQTYYALFDNASATADNSSDAIAGRGRLSPVTASGGTLTAPTFVWGRPTSDTDTTRRAGWYFDLPASSSGERQISDFSVIAGKLVSGSIIPAASTCDDGSGDSYVIDITAGGGTYLASNVGLLGQPLLITLSSAGSFDSDKDSARTQNGYTTSQMVVTGSGGVSATSSTTLQTAVRAGRLSWRQLNYDSYTPSTP